MKTLVLFVLMFNILIFSQNDYIKLNTESISTFLNMAIENGSIYYDSSSNKFLSKNDADWMSLSYVSQKQSVILNSYHTPDLLNGILLGTLSGISFGAHEAYAFNFKYSGWLGNNFLQDWYKWRPRTEAVFGRIFTWHKVWREIDYYSYNVSYKLIDRYFGGKWYITYPIVWTLRNTFATIIRDKFKTDNWWYSFDFDLLLSIPLTMP